jgi:protein-disulfide isomerase
MLIAGCAPSPDAKQPAQGARNADPFIDSVRVRRARELVRRPDTLGTRVDSARILGEPSARVWLVLVSEFQCARCRMVATDILPAIRREYVDPGKVRVAFVNWPDERHFNSRFASHAALCAGAAGHFWAMHDSLFASLPRWERLPDPQPFMDSLAISLGAAPEAQHSCTSRQRLSNLLEGDRERSERSGAAVRPTAFVGTKTLDGDNLTLWSVRRALDAALARSDASHK